MAVAAEAQIAGGLRQHDAAERRAIGRIDTHTREARVAQPPADQMLPSSSERMSSETFLPLKSWSTRPLVSLLSAEQSKTRIDHVLGLPVSVMYSSFSSGEKQSPFG